MIISDMVGIVADDLTEANEAALQFHLRGANSQILLVCFLQLFLSTMRL